jgi:hypothetical protein
MRVLNLLGVDVGPEQGLVEPGPGAPKGFWERYEIIRLNDRLLRLHGGSWRNPPDLAPGWEAAEELEPEREQARRLLERTFAGSPQWGWKDPRASLTTAFWRHLAPGLRFVICLRSPVDVANSISPPADARGEEAFYYSRRAPKWERAVSLWAVFMESALANTSGCPRLLISYDDYFDDRRRNVERLAAFLGDEPPPIGGEVDRAIERFLDRDLRHHRTTPEEVQRDERVPPEVAALYLETSSLCRQEGSEPSLPRSLPQR